MTRDVGADIESEEQYETDESEGAAHANGEQGPSPEPYAIVDGSGLRKPELELVQSYVDRSPPVVCANSEQRWTRFDNSIHGARMRLPEKQAGCDPVPKRRQEPTCRRSNLNDALDVRY